MNGWSFKKFLDEENMKTTFENFENHKAMYKILDDKEIEDWNKKFSNFDEEQKNFSNVLINDLLEEIIQFLSVKTLILKVKKFYFLNLNFKCYKFFFFIKS